MGVKALQVGAVQTKKSGPGSTIKLGNYSKDIKYATSVQVIVRDGQGTVVADVTDPYFIVEDPRTDKDGNPAKWADQVPAFILKKLKLLVPDNN